MTPDGAMTTFPAPAVYGQAITAGADGRMWFTEPGNHIGAITMSGAITDYALPSGVGAASIFGASNGDIWFGAANAIGRMTMTGSVTLFPLAPTRTPTSIAEALDGSIWFTEVPQNAVGRIDASGVVTEFPTDPPVCCGPLTITRGANDELWIAFSQGGSLARISSTGVVTPFASAPNSNVVTNAADRLWFATEVGQGFSAPRIGSLSYDGTRGTIVSLVDDVPYIFAMTKGGDGNIWATLDHRPCIGFEGFPCTPPNPPPFGIVRVNVRGIAHHRATGH